MELLDLVDINGNKLGKTIARGDKSFKEGEYIKIVVVYLLSNGKYLMQLASEEKGRDYAITGGHVPTGVSCKEQVAVECEEELGIKLKEEKIEYLGSDVRGHAIFDVYLYQDDNLEFEKMTLQEEEVEAVYWMKKEEIEKLIEDGKVRASTCQSYNNYIKNASYEKRMNIKK